MPSNSRRLLCECGNRATVFHTNFWVCERCARLQAERQAREKAPPRRPRIYLGSDYGVLVGAGLVWLEAQG